VIFFHATESIFDCIFAHLLKNATEKLSPLVVTESDDHTNRIS